MAKAVDHHTASYEVPLYELKIMQKDLSKAWGQVSPSIGLSGVRLSIHWLWISNPEANYPCDQLKGASSNRFGLGLPIPLAAAAK
jgi:hypothetical protein